MTTPAARPQQHWDEAPLTRAIFEAWIENHFVPHTDAELEYQQRVTRIEASLASWLQVVTVGGTIALAFGGALLSLYTFVLLEKNSTIQKMGEALSAVSERQQVVLRTIQMQGDAIQQLQRDQRTQNDVLVALVERAKR